MSAQVIEVIAVVSLTILAVSLIILVFAVIPLLSQLIKLLNNLDETVKSLNTKILPNLAEISDLVGKTKKFVDQGQNLGDKFGKTALALGEGLKSGIKSYFKKP
jgi:uncharacterized protein YoxC